MTTEAQLRLAPASTRVEAAIAAIANGEFVVVLDHEDRENEGDLIMAAELVTPQSLAFMIRQTSGLVCVGMTGERLHELDIPLMVQHGTEAQGTAFTVSVDLRAGTTTGISAADRAATIRALVDPTAAPGDFTRPGHVFPLRARPGGVLRRPGHTEAAVDLATLAGLTPAGVLCELVRTDGGMARGEDLVRFAAEHDLTVITIDELIDYRRRREQLVLPRSSATLPTPYGPFTVHAYESLLDGVEHMALVRGDVGGADPVLVRVHSECLTGDVLGSGRCDCGAQLQLALANIADAGRGVVVYLRGHEGRGIGLAAKIEAYRLQDGGLDTVEANVALGLPVDDREYGIGAQILDDLGVRAIRLMTNNPAKPKGLAGYGFEITERVPLIVEPTPLNGAYLSAKRRKLGHLLPQVPVTVVGPDAADGALLTLAD
ncbi:MAG: 3,4-dihydroxy 2-butanone 4-phosphate synthase / cyclohydrolase [Actinomycetota bacterium]|jgi:3,4-dihydroxy 2-butanone 4-phosphate synthase/GTP cyclohydrolase II|nr:3,4-dihydroxy 2-butanone 4-phosphate synthase / cyclohydrolase [Actinomycetota bacterium]